MDRKEKVNSEDYKATKVALCWYPTLTDEERKNIDIIDAYADGVIYGWNNPHWIPVEEKRPPFDWKDDGTWSSSLPILIYSIHGISIGTFQLDHVSGKSYWFFDGSKHEEFSDGYRLITHWMPLPEAPRKEADND